MVTPLDYLSLLRSFAAEGVVLLTAVLVLLLDLRGVLGTTVQQRSQRAAQGLLIGFALAFVALLALPPVADAPVDTFLMDPTTLWLKGALLVLAAASSVFLLNGEFTIHVGEFAALFLFATEGLLLMVGTENLLMLFVALELSSLSFYGLTALNQRLATSKEAALKYFFVGSAAAAFSLFGMSLLYGLTGSVRFSAMANHFTTASPDPLVGVALAMTLAGFGFKIAAAPFHAWAPDVYQAAPAPAAALVASGSKLAGLFVLLRFVSHAIGPVAGAAGWMQFQVGWLPMVALLAVTSMVLGNFAALAQTSLRRLVAWSAVAQTGYALVGLTGPARDALVPVLYFGFTYGLAVVGVLGVLTVLEAAGEPDRFESLKGLWQRSPVLAVCLTVFVLSLAGIPPLAGFFGKLFLFLVAAKRGTALSQLWLVLLALGLSVVSLYYYLQVLKPTLVSDPDPDRHPIKVSTASACTLVLLALGIAVFGIVPSWLFAGFAW